MWLEKNKFNKLFAQRGFVWNCEDVHILHYVETENSSPKIDFEIQLESSFISLLRN